MAGAAQVSWAGKEEEGGRKREDVVRRMKARQKRMERIEYENRDSKRRPSLIKPCHRVGHTNIT